MPASPPKRQPCTYYNRLGVVVFISRLMTIFALFFFFYLKTKNENVVFMVVLVYINLYVLSGLPWRNSWTRSSGRRSAPPAECGCAPSTPRGRTSTGRW